ncbi:MAG: dephospho-CoA kinase [Tenericutes bacterium]|jgi:dephospho-CoA kinase|nr:dephospho-CoA kinase [Mycoplasmatota bacterium]
MSVQVVKNNPTLIGLTGGIGSGKTTASQYFKSLNIPVIDCDEIVQDLWKNNKQMKKEVESFFKFPVKTKEDRKKLGNVIFNNKQKREQLNMIVHPYVYQEVEKQKRILRDQKIIIIDMPLLIEVNYQRKVDYVVLIYVDFDTQVDRLVNRDQISKSEAVKRIRSQLSLNLKRQYADYILDNGKTKKELYHQIDLFIEEIQNEE